MLIGEKRSCKEHMVSYHNLLVLCKLILCCKNYHHNIFFLHFLVQFFFLVLNLLVSDFESLTERVRQYKLSLSHSIYLVSHMFFPSVYNGNYFLITESLSSHIFPLCSTICWTLYQEISCFGLQISGDSMPYPNKIKYYYFVQKAT